MSTFGQRVRDTRRSRKLTQVELARRVKMSQGNLSDIENGHVPASTYTPALAEALGVNAMWLAAGRGEPEATSEPTDSVTYDTDVSPSLNIAAREVAAEYVPSAVTGYDEIADAVAGVLRLRGIGYADLVGDEEAARKRIEAILKRPAETPQKPSNLSDIPGARLDGHESSLKPARSRPTQAQKRKPA